MATIQPLHVQIDLASPICIGPVAPSLDGVLAWAKTQDELQLCDEDDPRHIRDLANHLPLDHVEVDAARVWKASFFIPKGRIRSDGTVDALAFTGHSQSRLATRKSDVVELSRLIADGFIPVRKLDPNNIAPFAHQLQTDGGLLKNYLFLYHLKNVSALEAWCVGDPTAIEDLLRSHVDFLGANRRLGHGKVKNIVVREDQKALQLWRLRPLPKSAHDASSSGDRVVLSLPLRPPYWAQENKRLQCSAPAIFF